MKKYGAIILNLLLLCFGICGLWFTVFDTNGFMNTGTFLYYTVQSNLLAMFTSVVLVIFEIRRLRGHEIPTGVMFLRLFSTIAITLTFLVFSLMLTPQMIIEGNGAYLTSPGNLFVHNLVPIAAILDWCFFGSAKKLKRGSAFCGTVPAIAYVIFVFVCVGRGIKFSGNTVPYFFLDYQRYGWFKISPGGIGVAYWIVILAVVLIGLGLGFTAIARLRERGKSARASQGEETEQSVLTK